MTATLPAIPALMREIIERVPGGASARSVIASEHVQQRPASHLPLPADMDVRLVEALARRPAPIRQLYRHQRDAWDVVARGEDLVVVTPTASGKTMCFNLPVIDRCLKFRPAKALYIYPTKALANDQLAALQELLRGVPDAPSVAAFHGDLGSAERAAIKADPPNIIIATPDILHHQQLPKHTDWAALWRDLHFVIIDEAHAYRGVFGSHIAHVMRRIRRTAARYGATPRFIAASATIGNPVEHVEALVGRRPTLVATSGAPEPGKDVVIWDPLILDGSLQGVAHRSSDQEAARLLVASLLAGRSTIVFARARRSVNRIAKQARKTLERAGRRDIASRLVAYVAGLTPERRHEIERGLREGTIKGVVATTALELGVDIGSLEVAILASYPGSTMGFRQQAGRAGRRERDALVVMVASQNPLDQYLAANPRLLFDATPEHAVTDIANDSIARGHLGCAAREHPIDPKEAPLFGEWLLPRCRVLSDEHVLSERIDQFWAGPSAARPGDVSLRSMEGKPYALLCGPRKIGEMDRKYRAREAHIGAIYLHDGETYRVRSVDHRTREIHLELSDEEVLTEPRGERYLDMLDTRRDRPILRGRVMVTLGRVKASTWYSSYVEVDEDTGRPNGRKSPIDPPERMDLDTMGIQFQAYAGVDPAALHGVEHLFRALAPLIVLCDRGDLDGHTLIAVPPVAYVYDNHPGGVGLAERIFESLDEILMAVAEQVRSCPCREGCPRCIHSGSCLHQNDELDKGAVLELFAGRV